MKRTHVNILQRLKRYYVGLNNQKGAPKYSASIIKVIDGLILSSVAALLYFTVSTIYQELVQKTKPSNAPQSTAVEADIPPQQQHSFVNQMQPLDKRLAVMGLDKATNALVSVPVQNSLTEVIYPQSQKTILL